MFCYNTQALPNLTYARKQSFPTLTLSGAYFHNKGPFTYYVIAEVEAGGLQMITLHVIVSNTTTVKVITEGLETGQKFIT